MNIVLYLLESGFIQVQLVQKILYIKKVKAMVWSIAKWIDSIARQRLSVQVIVLEND